MAAFTSQRACAAALDKLLQGQTAGIDSMDKSFASLSSLWSAKLPSTRESDWYNHGKGYWNTVSQDDYSGVLCGQQHVHDMDVQASTSFIESIRNKLPSFTSGTVLDCGAGMGRVSEALLVHHFPTVQLLEPAPPLLASARRRLGKHPRVTAFIESGLHEYTFGPASSYSCIWMQWVIGALLDVDLVRVLTAAAHSLAPGGCIILKENVCRQEAGSGSAKNCFWYDEEDSYIVRSPAYTLACISLAGLQVLHEAVQEPWDKELLPVHMWALVPATAARKVK